MELKRQPKAEISGQATELKIDRADPWVSASLLQKAIRRDHADLAVQAAKRLLHLRPNMFWSRCRVIAFEDIGLGDAGRVRSIMRDGLHGHRRSRNLFEQSDACQQVQYMAGSLKDRSADHLIAIAQHHPSLAAERDHFSCLTPAELRDFISNKALGLPERALAAWFAYGTDRLPSEALEKRPGVGDEVFAHVNGLGASPGLVEACILAQRKMPYPLPLFVSLLSAENEEHCQESVKSSQPSVGDHVPTYALGGHTRLGKKALRQLPDYSDDLRVFLERELGPKAWGAALDMALFYVESDVCAHQLRSNTSDRLKQLAAEADLASAGLHVSLSSELLSLMRQALPVLDEFRCSLVAGGGS